MTVSPLSLGPAPQPNLIFKYIFICGKLLLGNFLACIYKASGVPSLKD